MNIGLNLAPQHRVFGTFAAYSFCLGNIFPRLPDIQHAMGVEEGALGLGLIGTPLGTLVSLTFATPLLERIGYRRALMALIPLLALFYAFASFAPNPLTFFILLLPAGLAVGCIEIIINLEADRTEQLIGRRIMNRAHGFWSIGFFAAGLFGGFIAQLGIPPGIHLLLVVIPMAIVVAMILGKFEPAPARTGGNTDASPRFAAPTLGIMVLVLVTLAAMVMEGAYMDWSAIFMTKEFVSPPFLAAMAVALGAGAQAITRFFADGFVERYSPTLVARVLLSVVGIGILMVFFAPAEWVALAGLCAARRRHQRDLPAGHVGGGAAHRPAGGDQCRGAGADVVRHLPRGAAGARVRCPAFRHPLVVRHRHPVRHPELHDGGCAGQETGETRRAGGRRMIKPHHRVFACFFLFAVALGALLSRLPDLQRQLNLTESELGLMMIGMSVGSLVSLTLSAPWIERMGPRTTAWSPCLERRCFMPWCRGCPMRRRCSP